MPVEKIEDFVLEFDQGLEAIKPKKKKSKKKKVISKEETCIESLEKLSKKMSIISSVFILIGVSILIIAFPVCIVKFFLDILLPTWIAWIIAGCCGFCIASSLLEEIVGKLKE